jgi:protein O-GlcNAc transferase
VATVAEVFALALQKHQAGSLSEAEQLYRRILQVEPGHAETHYALGLLLKAAGHRDAALVEFQEALRCRGDFAEAMHELGDALVEQKRLYEAESSYRQALRLRPERPETHHNLGFALQNQGRLAEAEACFQEALRLNPNSALAHYSLGTSLQSQGRLDAAKTCYVRAVELQPDFADALFNLGSVLQSQGRLEEAMASYRRALAIQPGLAAAHGNLGGALQSLGRFDDAVDCYRDALALNPGSAETHSSLGSALQSQGRLEEAAASYRQAIHLKPDFAEAHNNLGLALVEMGRLDDAVARFQRAVQWNPEFAQAHSNLAGGLKELGRADEAIASYRRAIQVEPDNPAFLCQLVSLLQQICLWDDLTDLAQQVMDAVTVPSWHLLTSAMRSGSRVASSKGQTSEGGAAAVDPFAFLALPIPAAAHRQRAARECARQWVEQRLKCAGTGDARVARSRARELRPKIAVGYLSWDFQEHATAYLIAELIETHDRERFTIFGYSFGPEDKSPMRHRLAKAFDQFVDIKDSSFVEAAQRIQADEVDILVDLKGYTAHARPRILALRPAPLQVNYLGYAGTMGAPFIDYILVDDFVVPADQQPFFTEKLVHLPGCYQVNDSRREIATTTPSRAECGLPDEAFVFCCFNTCYKITPEMFTAWMGILQAVPGSVLWLLEANRFAPDNLRKEAQARGVAPQRLIFAPRLPLPDHLARHPLADLFLDTVPYNAHTTASDALWAGCPVLTLAGQTFPSRVAGSLLRALGLPELIAATFQEYEEKAVRLAREPQLLADLRARLLVNRETSPLFRGAEFAKNLEEAFATMWKIHTSGEQARAFAVGRR